MTPKAAYIWYTSVKCTAIVLVKYIHTTWLPANIDTGSISTTVIGIDRDHRP